LWPNFEIISRNLFGVTEIKEYKPIRIAVPLADVWNGVSLHRIRRISVPAENLASAGPAQKITW